ncbi:MAG: histidinol dehydrogenase [Candidatus Bathyarchaeota archaeon]|nr:MAG: histidinol dehydrogenase [Candidatus Bathyarchaeota archaeon]
MKVIASEEFKKTELEKFLNRGKSDLSSIVSTVRQIIDNVKENGDAALVEYTKKFDKVSLTSSTLRVSETEIKQAYEKLDQKQIGALQAAADNIAIFHKKQIRAKWTMQTTEGVTLGQVMRPLSCVGVYAPGGKAAYPSSVLMSAIPAKVAGVERVIVCSPPRQGQDISPALLIAADIAGVDEVYRVGGAQAIAAMAYGTTSMEAVEKIVGPGNVYVTAAKLEVSRDVAIDVPAGPSEVLVIADETANPAYVAADLLAQAEHDPQAWAILITCSENIASEVKKQIDIQLKSLSRTQIIESSLQKGLIITTKNITEAIELSNLIAPEHLQIQTKAPDEVFNKIRNAGAVFLGRYSPVSFGDYSSGLNHVLPTAGYAKIYSGLSSLDFVKTMNFLECTKEGFNNLKDTAVIIAEMEGFDAHAKAVSIREEKEK